VHCHAGESRTSFVLRAWLMQHEHLDVNEATDRLNASWPHGKQQNDGFEHALARLAI
jgi:protein-tyrosine phosphatase